MSLIFCPVSDKHFFKCKKCSKPTPTAKLDIKTKYFYCLLSLELIFWVIIERRRRRSVMALLSLRWVTSPLFGSVTPGARPQTCSDITASSEINITPPDGQSEGRLAHRPSDVTPRALFLPDDKRRRAGTRCDREPGAWRHCPPIRSRSKHRHSGSKAQNQMVFHQKWQN